MNDINFYRCNFLDGPKLSVVGQPQLFSLTQSAPASVITRVIPQAPALTNISKSSPGPTMLPQRELLFEMFCFSLVNFILF